MSPSTPVTPALLDTVLGHLAPHFLACANGDVPTARHAASRMLADYDTHTGEELHLATDIISFGFHALAALSLAAAPDLPLNKVLRLRGSAVSLSREAHKARRKLDQLKRARLTASKLPDAPLDAHPPTNEPTPPEIARETPPPATHAAGTMALTRAHQQRQATEQIAEKFRRNKAEQERRVAEAMNAATAGAIPSLTQDLPAASPTQA